MIEHFFLLIFAVRLYSIDENNLFHRRTFHYISLDLVSKLTILLFPRTRTKTYKCVRWPSSFLFCFVVSKSSRTNHVIVTVDVCSLVLCRIMIIDRVFDTAWSLSKIILFLRYRCRSVRQCSVVLLSYSDPSVIRVLSSISLSFSLSDSLYCYYYL